QPAQRSTPSEAELQALRELPAPPVGDAATRDALWHDAGIVRSADGLSRLLDSPHPLVRLIARCALTRAESRGAHQRLDYPERDPALDHRHVVVRGGSEPDGGAELEIDWQRWD
ncbi:MAG TPA: hypothetical protein VN817_04320, partial [Solirubrobacteraceae bacterium]|nr:hypothetical protein [Solirubrobacteraceae bacterium]